MSFEKIKEELLNDFKCPYCQSSFYYHEGEIALMATHEHGKGCTKYFCFNIFKDNKINFYSGIVTHLSQLVFDENTRFKSVDDIFKYIDFLEFYG